MLTKMEMAKDMEGSLKEGFANHALDAVLRRPGMTAGELAAEMAFVYDKQFKRNLVKATDSQKIHVRNERYYAGARMVY